MASGCSRLDMCFLFILATDALHKEISGICEFWWCTDPHSFYFFNCMYAWEAKASLCLHVQSCPMHTSYATAEILLVEEVLAETHQRLSAYKVYQAVSISS
jgi:hypothetical protein